MTRAVLAIALLVFAGCGSDAPSSVVYPHAIVNRAVSQAAFRAMSHEAAPADQLVLGGADVLRDTDPPRSVLHFASEVGLTERQARVVAHETSHLTVKLLRTCEPRLADKTHELDGGVIPR